jgi:hypothetical protein
MDALDYLKANGAVLEKDYPYTGKTGTCLLSTNALTGPSRPKASSWLPAVKPCTAGACSTQQMYEIDLLFAVKTSGPFIAYGQFECTRVIGVTRTICVSAKLLLTPLDQ